MIMNNFRISEKHNIYFPIMRPNNCTELMGLFSESRWKSAFQIKKSQRRQLQVQDYDCSGVFLSSK